MDWVAILSTPAVVALLTGGVSLMTLRLANRHADRAADRQAAANQTRLDFEARERRYEDRRDAVIELDRAAERETDRIESTERDPQTGYLSPGDLYDEYRFPELLAAHARVSMLATPEVVAAADALRDAIVAAFNGEKDHWEAYARALELYRVRSRAMLTNDAQSGPGAPAIAGTANQQVGAIATVPGEA